jgi:hypothetical protein
MEEIQKIDEREEREVMPEALQIAGGWQCGGGGGSDRTDHDCSSKWRIGSKFYL